MNLPDQVRTARYNTLKDKKDGNGVYATATSKTTSSLEGMMRQRKTDGYYQGVAVFPDDDFDGDNQEHRNREAIAFADDLDDVRAIMKKNPEMTIGDAFRELNDMPSKKANANTAVNNFRNSQQGTEFEPHTQKGRDDATRNYRIIGLGAKYGFDTAMVAEVEPAGSFNLFDEERGANIASVAREGDVTGTIDLINAKRSRDGKPALNRQEKLEIINAIDLSFKGNPSAIDPDEGLTDREKQIKRMRGQIIRGKQELVDRVGLEKV